MTTLPSDFPKAIARLSEGFCPLCDADLRAEDVVAFQSSKPVRVLRWREGCGVSWSVDTSLGHPALQPSRVLTKREIKKLYDRTGEATT